MIDFDATHNPPALTLQVTIRNTLNRRFRRTLPALIDTGADISAIPVSMKDVLQLYPVGRFYIEGVGSSGDMIYSYKVRLLIAEVDISSIEVIETPLDFAVIGRDVLKYFDLHIYGGKQEWKINAADVAA